MLGDILLLGKGTAGDFGVGGPTAGYLFCRPAGLGTWKCAHPTPQGHFDIP